MNYYKRHIGDYHKKAGRLSLLQHGVYTILMDAIYDRERFPTREEAIDWCWASSPDEVQAVDFVLAKFFQLEGDRYQQGRIREEMDAYSEFCETQKEKGKKGGRPKAGAKPGKPGGLDKKPGGLNNKPDGNPEKAERTLTTNHKPLTTNQYPPLPPHVNPDAWGDFEEHRKEIRQPLTDRARSKAFNQLEGLSFDEQAKVIDMTIVNRWRGLFPEKRKGNGVSRPSISDEVGRLVEKYRPTGDG